MPTFMLVLQSYKKHPLYITISVLAVLMAVLPTSDISAQIPELDQYYLQNSVLARNRVKKSREAGAVMHGNIRVEEYDSLGRVLAWYYEHDSVQTVFQYYQKGDTLLKYSATRRK